MAVYQFSALSDGQAITFNAAVDRLNFDQTNVAAGDLSLVQEGSSLHVIVKSGTVAGKDIFLNSTALEQIAATNFTFVDGSITRVGDNSVGTTGDAGANVIAGGAGRDLLMGLGGNDNLQAGDNSDSLVGGAGNDTVSGNNGNDWIEGGTGNDTLNGGGGQDTFILRETGTANADLLADFASGWDRIELDAATLTAIGAQGRFSASDPRFFAGTAAHDADDRIIYNSATGQILYDADGNGSGAAQLIAMLPAGRGVVAGDFNVIGTPPSGGNTINGTNGNDTLTGTAGPDTINGLGGNDVLFGAGGADSVSGGDGNDSLYGVDTDDPRIGTNTFADTLDGGAGNDSFFVRGAEVLADSGGVDTVFTSVDWTLATGFENLTLQGDAFLTVHGNTQNNVITNDPRGLEGGFDHIFGEGGNDTLTGFGPGILDGGTGDDVLFGAQTNDMTGGAGADAFDLVFAWAQGNPTAVIRDFSSGVDKLHVEFDLGTQGNFAPNDPRFYAAAGANAGHDADDRIIYDTSNGLLYWDADGSGSGTALVLAQLTGAPTVVATDIFAVNGSSSGQTINGTAGNDTLTGTDGPDTINGFGGDDSLDGAFGADSLDGGAGNDYLFGGSDVDRSGEGADILVGGDGNDTLDGWSISNSTTPDSDIETLDGGLGNDVFNVDNEADVLRDAGGTDLVQVRTGDWTLAAGFENLIIFDQEDGTNEGIGNELDNVMESRAWEAELQGMGGNDLLTVYELGGRTQILRGGDGNDTLLGSSGTTRTTLDGGAGDDSMVGESATMTGGDGNDTLVGGSGLDFNDMTGGTGTDRFVFTSADNFTFLRDFASGSDRLVLDGNGFAGIGGSGDLAAGDERFYAAAGATAAHDATDRIIFNTSTGDLYYDADGTGSATALRIAAVTGTLAATDVTVINGTASGGQTINGTAGNDSLVGGPGNDTINGFAGNDTIDGSVGADSMVGGTGNDVYFVDNSGDVIVEFENEGIDEVRSSVDYTLSDWVNNLTLTGDAHFGTGNAIDNVIVGTGQSNVLDGGAGADTMNGGLGDDDYHVDNVGDVLIDSGGFDNVNVVGLGSWTLGAGFESLWARNDGGHFDAFGNDLDNTIRVEAPSSFIDGGAGNDALRGYIGSDTIVGGTGNDTVEGDFGNDSIDGGSGNDFVIAGFGNDSVIGGAGNDYLDGGANDDLLDGGDGDDFIYGGAGDNDTLLGGAGADRMFGGGGADSMNGGDGNDTLDAQSELNEFGDTRIGPSQDAVDTLEGGLGNDTFVFVRTGDIVSDAGGIDTIVTDVSWTLGAAFENLTLVGNATTSGIGNALANQISGSDGNNFLQAGGGADTVIGGAGNDTIGGNEDTDWLESGLGNDTVAGGSGQDHFVFRESGSANADVLTDFASNWDDLRLDDAAFANIGALGKFTAGDARFFAGAGITGGHDANDRVVYDTSTGNLYYDADGSGSGAAQLVATLQTHPAISATDISVI